MGLAWALVYYVVFRFCISKFKVAIPGSEIEIEEQDPETPTESKDNTLAEEAQIIITALGEEANIENVTACATRLRVSVTDNQIVDKDSIQKFEVTAVFEVDGGVQAVFGGKANILSQEINQKLETDD